MHTGFDGQTFAVRSERAEDYEVGVQILGNAQHTGAAKFRGERKAIAFEFGGAAGVRIDLLPAGGQRLNGEFFEAFAEPIEARRCASVLKGEDKVDAGLGCAVGPGRRLSAKRRGAKKRQDKHRGTPNGNEAIWGHCSYAL